MNTFGNRFKVTLTGGSHEAFVGAVVEGVPAGLALDAESFAQDIDRRRPAGPAGTSRREPDTIRIVSGIRDGLTTGGPLRLEFANTDVRPSDYALFEAVPRPGHADFTSQARFGRTFPGGGIFSGRMTLPLVAAGVVAKRVVEADFQARTVEVGGSSDPSQWDSILEGAKADGDSVGGVVECRITGLEPGLGNPFFGSVESEISRIVFSIPGVRGIEFGDGFRAAAMRGSDHNDPFGPDGKPLSNGAGGLNGGITNGAPVVFRVAFKPTSTISRAQETFDFKAGKMTTLEAPGRHDVCFALRCPVVVEAAAAIAIADIFLSLRR